jgi:hypothetical protein
MAKTEPLAPNFGKLDTALRSIGYTFEVAVADIVDNSIDARASSVLVRLFIRKDGHIDVVVADDGRGMDAGTLREAMRFGADVSAEVDRLGKFGLGLKLASLSQAKELHVITEHNGRVSGRAWLEHGIAKGFESTIYDKRECAAVRREYLPDIDATEARTIVCWSHLYRLGHTAADPSQRAQKLMHKLAKHLALSFHRFLSGAPRRTQISVDIFDQRVGTRGIPLKLDALDPFRYPTSGMQGFPTSMRVQGRYANALKINAHIWPPNSDAPEYKLPGGANARQGFYFYRNNRLIQAGGWNGTREPEPHSSLARIAIDLPPALDVDVSIDVKKVEIQLPLQLTDAIQSAETSRGVDFKRYLALAQDAYRKRRPTGSELPLIPSTGLPAGLRDYLRTELRHAKSAKHRDLSFEWAELDKDHFFDVERDDGKLVLNSRFRRALLRGGKGSPADLPVLKCLLFLVLREIFSSERTGSRMRQEMEQANRILATAARYERGGD